MIPPHVLDAIRAAPLAPIVAEYVILRKSGQGRLIGLCPFHRERTPSFVVYADHWHCYGCGESGDVIAFLRRIQCVSYIEAVKYLADRMGLRCEDKYLTRRQAAAQRVASAADAVETEFAAGGRGGDILELEAAVAGGDFGTASPNGSRPAGGRIAETYRYVDETGRLLSQTVRKDPKGFSQRRPNGNGGWIWNLKGVRLVLYRLPELLKRSTETVFICEGEKDVHSLETLGLLATCNPMGAGKWRPEYSETLRARSAVIFPDNDGPGRKHATAIAADLLRVGCEVRIVEVPKGKDVSDWLAAGTTLEELRRRSGLAT